MIKKIFIENVTSQLFDKALNNIISQQFNKILNNILLSSYVFSSFYNSYRILLIIRLEYN